MSKYDPALHHRRSIRIPGYDYSLAGAYYVTLVIQGREHLLGNIQDGEMILNQLGHIVRRAWFDLPASFPGLVLDAFVIMPNHVHGILLLQEDANARHGLPEIVRAFKSFSARRINHARKMTGHPFWQRNYYEHVIRDNEDYRSKRDYIEANPLNWEKDEERGT